MNITINPINIKIGNSKYFADVAFLLDREDFIGELSKLREKWGVAFGKKTGVEKKILEYDSKKREFPFEKTSEIRKFRLEADRLAIPYEKQLYNLYPRDELGKVRENVLKKYIKALRVSPEWDLFFDVRFLRRKFKRPHNFDNVIKSALLFGEVRDEDYSPCSTKIIYPEVDFLPYFEDPELVIRFSPLVKLEDIRNLLTAQISKMREDYERDVLGGVLKNNHKTEIFKKHREWYLLYKEGLNEGKIYDKEVNHPKGIKIDSEGIKIAIDRYIKILQIPL